LIFTIIMITYYYCRDAAIYAIIPYLNNIPLPRHRAVAVNRGSSDSGGRWQRGVCAVRIPLVTTTLVVRRQTRRCQVHISVTVRPTSVSPNVRDYIFHENSIIHRDTVVVFFVFIPTHRFINFCAVVVGFIADNNDNNNILYIARRI